MRIQVEARAGHRDMPMPRALCFDGRRLDVVETLDQWFGPDHRYVKVRTHDEALYILRYDELRAHWELTMFERPGLSMVDRPQTRKRGTLM
ncbi:hypothetical protein [Bradyrhizobium sp. LHD-71]|uniref:hypothetical protein n=1 Tax=Bradyrhizobium sp. LHD-71 TaxID=3072141 RepID=UPI00280E6CE0|nr:hypothetical protein [Bradyrhizobium sp. LHD-71]MDQ8730225.1 hypothetical protein [Bradyrhizobium sp. LHD-71]